MNLGLEGRKAIVTGGSKGLGFAIAQELLREGASVAICSRSEDEVLAAAAELGRDGPVAHAQRADVTDSAQVRDFVARSAEALGGVDCLVNNAGRAHPGTFETLADADWSSDLDVKLFSLIRCCREVLPHMRAAGGGRIVNIGAVYGRYPDPTFFATSVNRAAEPLVRQDPGAGGREGQHPRQHRQHRLRRHAPVGQHPPEAGAGARARGVLRLLRRPRGPARALRDSPTRSPGLVAFLLSERASYITGASIDVAGGMGKYV